MQLTIENIINGKKQIIDAAVAWQKKNYPERTIEYNKCSRDIGIVLDAYVTDMISGVPTQIMHVGSRYWVRNKRQIRSFTVEFAVHRFIIDYIKTNIVTDVDAQEKLEGLMNTLLTIIEFGPVEAPASWQFALSKRINTYKWSDTAPSIDQINEILTELHSYAPSKQRRVRYEITVIKNDNPERKLKIYESTKADPSDPNSRYNPQVLAPWVLAFSVREDGNKEGRTEVQYKQEVFMDTGISSNFIVYSAASKGVASGFCGCIQNSKSLIDVIGVEPILFLGLGYPAAGDSYRCPIKNKEVNIPYSDFDTKPDFSSYIKYV